MLVVLLVLLAVAIAILAGVVATAMGRGGELTLFPRDVPADRLRLRSAADVAMLRLPTGFFGYQEQATSDVLRTIVGLLASQEAEIASLRHEVSQLSVPASTSSVPAGGGSVPMGTSSVSANSASVSAGTGSVSAGTGGLPAGVNSSDRSVPAVEPSGAADRDGVPDQPQSPL